MGQNKRMKVAMTVGSILVSRYVFLLDNPHCHCELKLQNLGGEKKSFVLCDKIKTETYNDGEDLKIQN